MYETGSIPPFIACGLQTKKIRWNKLCILPGIHSCNSKNGKSLERNVQMNPTCGGQSVSMLGATSILTLLCKTSTGHLWVGGWVLSFEVFPWQLDTFWSQRNQGTLNRSEYPILTVFISLGCFYCQERRECLCASSHY